MRRKQRSIFRSLQRGFLAVGITGMATLILLGFMDMEDYLFGGRVRAGNPKERLTPEVIEHALFPFLFLLLPLFAATIWVIRRSLRPLSVAAERIEAARLVKRGVRIDATDIPSEALPFVEAINGVLQRLDDAAVRLEAFASDAAHELRTPLAIMLLELRSLDHAAASNLKRDVEEMSLLVDHLLLTAQLDAEEASPLPEEVVSLEAAARAVVQQLSPLAQSQEKSLDYEIISTPSVPGHVEAIKAALRNLIENGLRASSQGGSVKVTVGPGARIRVQDSGAGLSKDELTRLRSRFVRVDRAGAGYGLGLSIVSRIMELHRGELETDPDRRELILVFNDEAPSAAAPVLD